MTGHWPNLFESKYLFESKHQLLINGRRQIGIEKLQNPIAFTDYLETIEDVYENLEDYNPTKKRKVDSVLWHYSRYGRFHFFSYHNLIPKYLKPKTKRNTLFYHENS